MKKIRVLSLDGGGIRGIIPATIIAYIEKEIQRKTKDKKARIAEYFDFFAGTSTGGILSLFYLTPNPNKTEGVPTTKFSADEAVEFYTKKGFQIFNGSKNNFYAVRQLFNATKYKPEAIENIFKENFKDLKLKEALKPCMLTTYDMVKKSSFFFCSFDDSKKRDFYIRDVARSTSAAPTYFPPAFIKNLATNEEMINLDGGVFANNPAMCAYAELRGMKDFNYPTAKDLLVLSIGTGGGNLKLKNKEDSSKWGALKWATNISDIMMDGAADTVDFQMRHLFGSLQQNHKLNYKRIDVEEKDKFYEADMSDASPSNIKNLVKSAELTLSKSKIGSETQLGLDAFINEVISMGKIKNHENHRNIKVKVSSFSKPELS